MSAVYDESVHENPWLSLRKIVAPSRGVEGYVYSHETRCNGQIVALMPYRHTAEGVEFLLRREVTPCWGMQEEYSSLTGGVEPGADPRLTAQSELHEEAGYLLPGDGLKFLGTSFASKSSDTRYFLYTVDLTDKKQGAALGDGTPLDVTGTVHWVSDPTKYSQDPQVWVLHRKVSDLLATAHPKPVVIG